MIAGRVAVCRLPGTSLGLGTRVARSLTGSGSGSRHPGRLVWGPVVIRA